MAKRVALIGAGGTIAMAGAHAFDWLDYGDTGIIHDAAEIVADLELGLPEIELQPVLFRALPSTAITPDDWFDLAVAIADLLDRQTDIVGVVVTHGTASLEETAFFLHLVHRHAAPVVVVGAQRPPNTAASDAVANLRAAVRAAAAPILRDAGVFVAMDGRLHAAARVAKVANHTLDAFQSAEFGPLGMFDPDGRLRLASRPAREVSCLALPAAAVLLPRVDIAFSYAGADGTAVEAFTAAGARGLVLAGMPPGRSTSGERAAAERAARSGVVVVQASRALMGCVPPQRYNSAVGFLSGGSLSPQKARIAVMLGLAAEFPPADLQALLLAF